MTTRAWLSFHCCCQGHNKNLQPKASMKNKKPGQKAGFFWLPKDGAQGRTRTTDTRIFSPLLYQLSYLGKSDFRLRFRSVPCGTSGVIQTPLGLVQPQITFFFPSASRLKFLFIFKVFQILWRLAGGNCVAFIQPLAKVEISTALRAKRLVFFIDRFTANGTVGAGCFRCLFLTHVRFSPTGRYRF